MHTPALYSSFLRALISAKVDPPNATQADETMDSPKGEPPESTETVGNITGDMGAQHGYGSYLNGPGSDFGLGEFQLDGEMGPVADMSTFPPTMVANHHEDSMGMLSMDSILSSGFWDSVLMPGVHSRESWPEYYAHRYSGYSNSMEGLSGGFVYGAGGSGLITPHFGQSPAQSGATTPSRAHTVNDLTQHTINNAFEYPSKEGILIKSDV